MGIQPVRKAQLSTTPSRFAMQAAPESTALLLRIQAGLEDVFGKGSIAIVGGVAMNLNFAVTGQKVDDKSIIRDGGDVDFMLARRLPDSTKVDAYTARALLEANFKLDGEIIYKVYESDPPAYAGANLSAGMSFEGIKIDLLNNLINVPAHPVVKRAYTETYGNPGSGIKRLTFATLPFLIITKCEPSGRIRREEDTDRIRGILDTYYEGSLATLFEKERAAFRAVSRHISKDFRQGLFESLQRK